jgi:hypothetical protein
MDIHPCGSAPSRRAKAEWFTGTVWQDPIVEAPEPARVRATNVRFEPGARTNWHTHPLGQTAPATWCGFRRMRNTGTAPLRRRPWSTSPSMRHSTASMSIGWRRSPTRNTTARKI